MTGFEPKKVPRLTGFPCSSQKDGVEGNLRVQLLLESGARRDLFLCCLRDQHSLGKAAGSAKSSWLRCGGFLLLQLLGCLAARVLCSRTAGWQSALRDEVHGALDRNANDAVLAIHPAIAVEPRVLLRFKSQQVRVRIRLQSRRRRQQGHLERDSRWRVGRRKLVL